jgi:hypothetical protein
LEEDALFVLEKRPEETLPDMPLWNLQRQKKYGATEVLFLAPRSLHRRPADDVSGKPSASGGCHSSDTPDSSP